jgi:hypothetical protein
MDKKLVAAVAVALAGTSQFALAQAPSPATGLKFTVGVKAWANTWETSINNDGTDTGTNIISTTSKNKLAAIPSVSARWGNWVASYSYFTKTKYDFKDYTQVYNSTGAVGGPSSVARTHTSAERKEQDFNIGYFVTPALAVTLGYKEVRQKYTQTQTDISLFPGASETGTGETKYKGYAVGLLGSAPLGASGLFLYGNGAIGPTKATGLGSADAKGWYGSSELGLGMGLANNFTVTAGVKYQILDVKVNGDQRGRDTTSGFILGANYTF